MFCFEWASPESPELKLIEAERKWGSQSQSPGKRLVAPLTIRRQNPRLTILDEACDPDNRKYSGSRGRSVDATDQPLFVTNENPGTWRNGGHDSFQQRKPFHQFQTIAPRVWQGSTGYGWSLPRSDITKNGETFAASEALPLGSVEIPGLIQRGHVRLLGGLKFFRAPTPFLAGARGDRER